MGNIFRKCIRNSALAANNDVEYNENVSLSLQTHGVISDSNITKTDTNGYRQQMDDLDIVLRNGDTHVLRDMIDDLTWDHLNNQIDLIFEAMRQGDGATISDLLQSRFGDALALEILVKGSDPNLEHNSEFR